MSTPAAQGVGAPRGATQQKSGKGGCIVLVLLLLSVLGAGGYVAWRFLGGGAIQSNAREHLPSGCSVVAHLDVAGIMKVPAVAKHVLPVLEAKAKNAPEKGKLAKLLVTARLNPKKDVHGVAVCVKGINPIAASGSAVVIVGGKLVPGALLKAMKTHAKDGKVEDTTIGGKPALAFKSTPAIYAVQAKDAALIVGNDKSLIEAAMVQSQAHQKEYKLSPKGHVALVATQAAAKSLPKGAGKKNPLVGQLLSAESFSVMASLDPGSVEVRLGMASETTAAALSVGAEGLLTMALAGGSLLMPPMLKNALAKRKIEAQGKYVVATMPIPAEAVEEGAKALAFGLEKGSSEL